MYFESSEPKSEIFHSNLLSMENMNLADVRRGERCFTRAIFVACKTATANAGSNQFSMDQNSDKKVSWNLSPETKRYLLPKVCT